MTFALRDHGFDVFVTGYDTAINELVREQQPAALVLDCSVYAMSEALFDSLRADADHVNLPIVIVSDTPERADASLRAREAQQVLLIPKPFTGGQIARALSELLDNGEDGGNGSTPLPP